MVEPTRIVGRLVNAGGGRIDMDQPLSRTLGGYAIYISRGHPFSIERNGVWDLSHRLAVVQPFESHCLRRCEGLRTILIEPESVCSAFMMDGRWIDGAAANTGWMERIDCGFAEWERLGKAPDRPVNETFFGGPLPEPRLDPRIGLVASRLARDPGWTVTELAALTGLSPSRLTHLFSEQLGIPIRSFRAWKRARNSIALTISEPILLRAALDAGYSDEAHFSRSMRKYFGQHAHLMRRHWRQAMVLRNPMPADHPREESAWASIRLPA